MYNETILKTAMAIKKDREEREKKTKIPRAQVIVLEKYGETRVEEFKTLCETNQLEISGILRSLMEGFTSGWEGLDEKDRP